MLVDEVTVIVKAGDGGNGAVHFRRNAQTAWGGPDGGNGGRGGDVYFQGIDDILGLREFRFKKVLAAENGIHGGRQNLYGRSGQDLLVNIPLGTLVTDTVTQKSFEITDTIAKLLVAKGGEGGRGNNEFKSATNQTPKYAEKGGRGEEKTFDLKLRLIADVGLIGLPNAGKSSLLKVLTNATPKIGNYPFTTLEPNIGMMNYLAIADIPGLIEGASSGKGLGIQFLKHIEKTTVLIHCIDAGTDNPTALYYIVRNELQQYNPALLEKQEIILLTKHDTVTKEMLLKKTKELQKMRKHIASISLYDDNSLQNFKAHLLKTVMKKT
ncbi:MAG TPA: GTPase ObgE [Patescibacteria group bacterium]|nr:GTPase ObgE [Patescibacteria group bacterium]